MAFASTVKGSFERGCVAASSTVYAVFALVLVLGQETGLPVPYWLNHFLVASLIFFTLAAVHPVATYFIDARWLVGLVGGTSFYIGKEIGDYDKISKCFDETSSLGIDAALLHRDGVAPPSKLLDFDWPGFLAPTIGLTLLAIAVEFSQRWYRKKKDRRCVGVAK